MIAKELAQEILKTGKIIKNNKAFELNSNIDQKEGNFLSKIIEENKYTKTIEIGCAYGISSLFICDALQNSNIPSHTIIDPFQSTDWKNIGVENLRKCNIDFYNLIEKPSELALPELLAKKKSLISLLSMAGIHLIIH
jgi:predicted O-methyltransferase YrrM